MKVAKSAGRVKRHQLKSSTSNEEDQQKNQDPVEVYCRIRPVISSQDEICISLTSANILTLTPPDLAKSRTVLQYGFKHVFTEHSTQVQLFQYIAVPLLEGLLQGKNGLLFTYGVTGSGKTYTMTGEPNDPGLMPRCINTLFNSIGTNQTNKYIVKSDKMNGFEIQSSNDAADERLREVKIKTRTVLRNKYAADLGVTKYKNDGMKLNNIKKNCLYTVFINYIEIYNNTVYDLLDDTYGTKLQPKILREDRLHNMYVNGVVELEVKSAEEAFELFNIGQKRKRMAHTVMNTESSRSHSIFTIRLIQGIFDESGEHLIGDSDSLIVAQLSLVDLAGSERCSRTQTTGQRLKEAGSINNSLMSLRTCLEILRENQQQGTSRIVPYRESRLTHIFKNYFEGEGKVEMIVCANPSVNDYDETVQVMKFAEMTQKVKITRAEAKVLNNEEFEPREVKRAKVDKLAPKPLLFERFDALLKKDIMLPKSYQCTPEADKINTFLLFLKTYMQKKIERKNAVMEKSNKFRGKIAKIHKDYNVFKCEISSLGKMVKKKRDEVNVLQNENTNLRFAYDALTAECEQKKDVIRELQHNVKETNFKLNQNVIHKEKEKKKFENKITKEFDVKLRQQRNIMTAAMKEDAEKIELVKDILMGRTSLKNMEFQDDNKFSVDSPRKQSDRDEIKIEFPVHHPKSTPVANKRYRRSRSVGDMWLEHKPAHSVPLGTVLQPVIKRRKSVTKLTEMKDVLSPKQSKYLLINQEQDTDGNLETAYYKGDIIPTCGGGAQVVFSDIEKLKQESPNAKSDKKLKRSSDIISDVQLSDKKIKF